MNHNFDEVIDRMGTYSIKWETKKDTDILPMWIADMDFKTAPPILEALQRRVAHGVLGYTWPPNVFFEAIQLWWQKRHGFHLDVDWGIPVSGVIPGLSAIVRSFTSPGDRILVQSPVYNHFFMTIDNCGCEAVSNDLIYQDGKYTMDFTDLEIKTSDPSVKMMLLCNPQNPVGRVWTKEELKKLGEICFKNDVIVVSDEIHSDIVLYQNNHVPFASLGEDFQMNSITCSSPSKTFNLAGVQVAYLFTKNSEFKKKITHTLNIQDTVLISPFAIEALMAAYHDGEPWLEDLKEYIQGNFEFVKAFFSEFLPDLKILPLEATYLVWIDCTVLGKTSKEICDELLDNHKLWLVAGSEYGQSGEGFIRMNIACPRVMVKEGLSKLKGYIG